MSAVLLPGTSYFLGKSDYAPARRLIDAGAVIALGTDLNPGSSYSESLLAVIQLACFLLRLTVDEALVAATSNAAHCLGLADDRGSVEVGKRADLLVHRVPSVPHLVYHYGINHVGDVIKNGQVVSSNATG